MWEIGYAIRPYFQEQNISVARPPDDIHVLLVEETQTKEEKPKWETEDVRGKEDYGSDLSVEEQHTCVVK